MEPKGQPFVQKDLWKEELLERINPDNVQVIGENDKVKLYGVRFYVEDCKTREHDIRHMFSELREKNLFPKEDDTLTL